jgi:uncharacterized SAM-binding protein YcdF (DUF218 family)
MSWLALALILVLVFSLPWFMMNGWKKHWKKLGIPLISMAGLIVLILFDSHSEKIISQLIMPLGMMWLLLLLMIFFAALNHQRMWCSALSVVFLILTFSSSNWIGSGIIRHIESDIPLTDPIKGEYLEAVFVMGGGSYRRRDGFPELGPSGDRLMVAAQVYHAKRTSLLIASGDLAEDARFLWERIGVPREAVICLGQQNNSSEEVLAYRQLIDERGWKRVGLISSARHLPRALKLCARQDFMPEPIPSDWRGDTPSFLPRELLPHIDGLEKTTRGIWELVGRVVGR